MLSSSTHEQGDPVVKAVFSKGIRLAIATRNLSILLAGIVLFSVLLAVRPAIAATGNIHVNSMTGPSPAVTISIGESLSLYFGDVDWSGGQVDLYISADGYASLTIPGDMRYGPTFSVADITNAAVTYEDGYRVGYNWINGTIPETLDIPGGPYFVKAFDGAANVAVTDNYFTIRASLEIVPSSGPGRVSLELRGYCLPSNDFAELSYDDGTGWTTIQDNVLADDMGRFSYSMLAPDLMMPKTTNPGQIAETSDVVRFRMMVGSTEQTVIATFDEYRRGMKRVMGATGALSWEGWLYGNGSDFFTPGAYWSRVDVEAPGILIVAGKWFRPGTLTILLDMTTTLGTAVANPTQGWFNTSVPVPATTGGRHRVAIDDGNTIFWFYVNVIPTVILESPIAYFTYQPSSPEVDRFVLFDASGSFDPDGTITRYTWDFGDGATITKTDFDATHAYSAAGTYTVTLTVTDNDDLTDTVTETISVRRESSFISISLSASAITSGESTTIWGSISPPRPGIPVMIRYRRGGGEWRILATVTTDSDGGYSYTWSSPDSGTHEVRAMWEGDEKTEPSESEKVTLTVTEVVELPDLLLEDIVIGPTTPLPEEEVRIEAIVSNVGDKQAGEVQVLFMVDEREVARKTIELLAPDGRVAVEVTWVATTPGEHTLFVEIDFDGLIAEWEEGNNSDEKMIRVVGLPDLLLEDIVVSHETCRVGEQVSIEVTVCNEGESFAEGVEVVFSCGDWEQTTTIDVEPGGREVVEVTYTAVSSGSFPITVVVDPDRLIEESDEGNNEVGGLLGVDLLIDPPLAILGSGVVGVSAFVAWSFFHPRPPPYEMERGLEQRLDGERKKGEEDDRKREKKGHLVFFEVDEDPKRVVKSSSEATVRVRNVGTSPAKDVEVRASATQGITLEKSEVTIPEVKVRKTLRFPFNVDKAATRGIYYLRFKVKSKDTPEQTKRHPLRAAKIGLLSQGGKPESIQKLGEWLAKHDYNYASLRGAESYLRLLRHDIVIAPPDIETSPKGARNLCSFAERGHSILVVGMIETEELKMIASALGYSDTQYAHFETSHGVLRITDSQHPIIAGFGVGHEIRLGLTKGKALSSPVSTGRVLAELVVAEGERIAAIVVNPHGNGKAVHLNFSAEGHVERLDAILVEALNWLLLPAEADQ